MPDEPIEAGAEDAEGFHDPELEPDDRDDEGSISDRAANGEAQDEMFPLGSLEGDQKTLGNLIRGKPTTTTVSLARAEVPLRDGLLDPGKTGRVLVHYEPAKYEVVLEREDDGTGQRRLVGAKIRNHARPIYAEPYPADVGDAFDEAFDRLLASSPQAAGERLDGAKDRLSEYLRTGDLAAV
jgi:hypothetical protein